MSRPVTLVSFDASAPPKVWDEVADLFVDCFSAAPYFEDPGELNAIREWGPTMLAGSGRLITARRDGLLLGFALSHNLASNPSWQRTLQALPPHSAIVEMASDPGSGVVVHELAVRASERGRGIARACLRELLAHRRETHAVIGTYEAAESARAMYARWGFLPLGSVPVPGPVVALHVQTVALPWVLPPAVPVTNEGVSRPPR